MSEESAFIEGSLAATVHTTEGGYWGHHVEWLDYQKGRVYGHLRLRPKLGDLLTSPLKSGRTGVFRFTDVELLMDPDDMFFGTVEPLGYEDELDMAAVLNGSKGES